MRLKQLFLNITIMLALTLTPAALTFGTALAAPAACGNSPAAQQVLGGIDEAGNNCGDDRVNNLFGSVVTILSIVTGVIAVLVIIYAGFKYMTSGGEAGRVSNAKSTLLYALVGLAVAALAGLMVHFVLYRTS